MKYRKESDFVLTLLASAGIMVVDHNQRGGEKMKKWILAMLLAMWMLMALAGCGGEEPVEELPEEPPKEESSEEESFQE